MRADASRPIPPRAVPRVCAADHHTATHPLTNSTAHLHTACARALPTHRRPQRLRALPKPHARDPHGLPPRRRRAV
mgnify:CR=1 FL=1